MTTSIKIIFATASVISLLALTLSLASEPKAEKLAKTPQNISADNVDYHRDIQPILDRNCVACHSCNDAPCQLKLESGEGLLRGATKTKLYDGARLSDIAPTRLRIDAMGTEEWRNKGFFSVLDAGPDNQSSILKQLIAAGKTNPFKINAPLPSEIPDEIGSDLVCADASEVQNFTATKPHFGMPLGAPSLSDSEYSTLSRWLAGGAIIPELQIKLTDAISKKVTRWESFLNQTESRNKLVSRYLFEHLFLAHLYFEDQQGSGRPTFFKLVRSYSPAPLPIKPVSTIRPNGDPRQPFFYRLSPLDETIVHKTHITYALSEDKLQRLNSLFLSGDWNISTTPPYDDIHASNPFKTFQAIPAKARYQFMLDNAEYFTRTFIRGPVCRGQIATDVIRDQFWVMFEDPEFDLYIIDENYSKSVTPLLGLPGEKSDLISLGPEWVKYKNKRNQYLEKRRARYQEAYPKGPNLEHIWDGDGVHRDAFLTVFRHHNSASVISGWRGKMPLTAWVMDYPLFERTYYELVVGFNVFGSVSHQAQTRLYFDLIRNGGEVNFLRFIPPKERRAEYDNWYQGLAKLKQGITYLELDDTHPVDIAYGADAPIKSQLFSSLLQKHKNINPADPLNRCRESNCENEGFKIVPKQITTQMSKLSTAAYPAKAGIEWLPDVTLIRVDTPTDYYVFSLIRNRAHSNVAFMLGEELRYLPTQDSTSVIQWPVSSYPNFMFKVESSDLTLFTKALLDANTAELHQANIDRWGVRRSQDDFWDIFHSASEYELLHRPVQAGIFDLNRYRGW